jgi:hypothetical protein
MKNAINVLHSGAVSTLEVPCIVGEDCYELLLKGVDVIRDAYNQPNTRENTDNRRVAMQNGLFDLEGLILSNAAFGDFCQRELWFPSGYPSNLTSDLLTPFGLCGIMDTIENPCACKLMTDLEYIGFRLDIVSP